MAKPSAKVIAKKSAPRKPASRSSGVECISAPKSSTVSVRQSDGKGSSRSLEVRPIENGFIVRETTWSGKGDYKETERFSATAPKIDLGLLKKK